MRLDVLEAFAEATPGGIKLGKLAQLPSNFEGDRPKLDGIGFEYRESKKARRRRLRDVEISRLMKLRARHKNPEHYRDYNRAYYAANPEQKRATARRRKKQNNAAQRTRRANNPDLREAMRVQSLAYYHAHAEERKAKMRAYYHDNRDVLLAKAKARNAAKKAGSR